MKNTWKVILCGLVVSVCSVGLALADSEKNKGDEHRPDAAERFAKMDADGNGSVTLAEFKTAHDKRVADMKEHKGDGEHHDGDKTPPSAEEIFKHIDANSDGAITLDEMKAAHKDHKDHKEGKKDKKDKKD